MDLTRRRFLATGWPALLAAHDVLVQAGRPLRAEPGLLHLRLETATPLPELAAFYGSALGLSLTEVREDRVTIRGGTTLLTFIPAAVRESKPFYHFAFNIPENMIAAAREWQVRRTPLLPIPPGLRDPSLPQDVVHYRHWNAHSIFFFDPAGNVVEYIARHDLPVRREGSFSSADLLGASEIAFVVDDVLAAVKQVEEATAYPLYGGASADFAALGDERALLLLMRRGRVISFDAPQRKAVDVFPTSASVRCTTPGKVRPLAGAPYEIDRVR